MFDITVDLMLDLPQLSSSFTQVLLRIASVTFKTQMIVCILSDRVPKSSYASVYKFYPAITQQRITAAMYLTSAFDVVFDCIPGLVPLLMFCHIYAKENV